MLRKFGLLAVVCSLALCALTATALAAPSYQFKDGNGNVMSAGTFGENIQLKSQTPIGLTVTVPGVGTFTNFCDGYIGGQVTANSLSAALVATGASHTFDNCTISPTFATGTWLLTVPQAATQPGPGIHKLKVSGIDVLTQVGPGLCEFRGTLNGKLTNGAPSVLHVSGTLNVFNGSGTFSNGCPVTKGTASGDLITEANTSANGSNPTNIQIS